MRGFCLNVDASAYLLTPDPGPVGVNVDPLGEPFGASVFPDGLLGRLGVGLLAPVAMPVVEPGGCAVGTPFVTAPVVLPVAAEPLPAPAAELAPPLCASANAGESASAPAIAIVVSFMIVSFVVDHGETGRGARCSSEARGASMFRHDRHPPYFASVGRMRIFQRFQMRSSTMKLTLSAFSPSPGVR
jgi:hypothetical protein